MSVRGRSGRTYTALYKIILILLLSAFPVRGRHSFSVTCSLLSLQITMSSANIMVHGVSSPISSVILSITIANKQELKADLGAIPPSHLTTPSLIQHTSPLLYCQHRLHIFYYYHVLLYHFRHSHAIPHLLFWHLAKSFLQVHKRTM